MNDKIQGTIFGQAIGDAIGRYFDFRYKGMVVYTLIEIIN